MAAALVAAILVLIFGLGLTNLTNLVPWGLWICLDLSAIALSAGAFTLSPPRLFAPPEEIPACSPYSRLYRYGGLQYGTHDLVHGHWAA